jgi:hypothetical protein
VHDAVGDRERDRLASAVPLLWVARHLENLRRLEAHLRRSAVETAA